MADQNEGVDMEAKCEEKCALDNLVLQLEAIANNKQNKTTIEQNFNRLNSGSLVNITGSSNKIQHKELETNTDNANGNGDGNQNTNDATYRDKVLATITILAKTAIEEHKQQQQFQEKVLTTLGAIQDALGFLTIGKNSNDNQSVRTVRDFGQKYGDDNAQAMQKALQGDLLAVKTSKTKEIRTPTSVPFPSNIDTSTTTNITSSRVASATISGGSASGGGSGSGGGGAGGNRRNINEDNPGFHFHSHNKIKAKHLHDNEQHQHHHDHLAPSYHDHHDQSTNVHIKNNTFHLGSIGSGTGGSSGDMSSSMQAMQLGMSHTQDILNNFSNINRNASINPGQFSNQGAMFGQRSDHHQRQYRASSRRDSNRKSSQRMSTSVTRMNQQNRLFTTPKTPKLRPVTHMKKSKKQQQQHRQRKQYQQQRPQQSFQEILYGQQQEFEDSDDESDDIDANNNNNTNFILSNPQRRSRELDRTRAKSSTSPRKRGTKKNNNDITMITSGTNTVKSKKVETPDDDGSDQDSDVSDLEQTYVVS